MNTFGEEDGNEGINRRILMLLSAFHVSTPTLVYKHWLNAALFHLFYAEQIEAQVYLRHMESVAKAFVFDRFLAPDVGLDYFAMIYTNGGICQARLDSIAADTFESRLTFGNIENNLVFNFLDYLLWLEHRAEDSVRSYEFTFRSSVEHYYPQNPLDGQARLDADTLNSFGNLCLISHSKNSRLSNFMPSAKKEFYKNNTIDSVKQHLMMKTEPWDADAIRVHSGLMSNVLLNSLASKHETE
ncbi:HNH endonuclease family protein [Pseudomonas siliginis]|uniref:HNH endonuclease family protein n=1 Tax=Pseudomonas siliginis TaxID=2842346 RepID=UPI003C2B58F1